MASKDLITIDTSALSLIQQDGDKFLIDPRAEEVLLRWKEFLKFVEEVDEQIKAKLQAQMEKLNTLKIEGENVKVIRRYFGERYELFDPQLVHDMGFAKRVESYKADTKEIDRYVKDTGELPEGVKLRERAEKVVISNIKGKEE